MALGLFGTIGTTELVVIMLVALLMFGGRLPDVARSLGKSVNQFKKGLKDVDDTMNRDDPPDPPAATPKSLPPRAESAATPVSTPTPEKSHQD